GLSDFRLVVESDSSATRAALWTRCLAAGRLPEYSAGTAGYPSRRRHSIVVFGPPIGTFSRTAFEYGQFSLLRQRMELMERLTFSAIQRRLIAVTGRRDRERLAIATRCARLVTSRSIWAFTSR